MVAPHLWNAIPLEAYLTPALLSFMHLAKTHLPHLFYFPLRLLLGILSYLLGILSYQFLMVCFCLYILYMLFMSCLVLIVCVCVCVIVSDFKQASKERA